MDNNFRNRGTAKQINKIKAHPGKGTIAFDRVVTNSGTEGHVYDNAILFPLLMVRDLNGINISHDLIGIRCLA